MITVFTVITVITFFRLIRVVTMITVLTILKWLRWVQWSQFLQWLQLRQFRQRSQVITMSFFQDTLCDFCICEKRNVFRHRSVIWVYRRWTSPYTYVYIYTLTEHQHAERRVNMVRRCRWNTNDGITKWVWVFLDLCKEVPIIDVLHFSYVF